MRKDSRAMRLDHHSSASSRTGPARWASRLLRLYPLAWRERYGDEVTALLAKHTVTYWTVIDILLGAIDAHSHRDLLPERLTSMAHRIRSSEIATFCAFMLFCTAWLLLRLVRDPLPVWQAAVDRHPELLRTLTLLDLSGLVATLAILVGGLPILFVAVAQSIAARRWKLLALFTVPLLGAAVLVILGFANLRVESSPQSGTSGALPTVAAPLSPLAIAVQLGVVLLLLGTVGGSVAAVAVAIGRSEIGTGVLRFALLPAGIATVAIALGLLAATALDVLIFSLAPQVSAGPLLHVADLLAMLAAVVLAVIALERGIRAARGRE